MNADPVPGAASFSTGQRGRACAVSGEGVDHDHRGAGDGTRGSDRCGHCQDGDGRTFYAATVAGRFPFTLIHEHSLCPQPHHRMSTCTHLPGAAICPSTPWGLEPAGPFWCFSPTPRPHLTLGSPCLRQRRHARGGKELGLHRTSNPSRSVNESLGAWVGSAGELASALNAVVLDSTGKDGEHPPRSPGSTRRGPGPRRYPRPGDRRTSGRPAGERPGGPGPSARALSLLPLLPIPLAEPGPEAEVTVEGRTLRCPAAYGDSRRQSDADLALITGECADLAPPVLTGPTFARPARLSEGRRPRTGRAGRAPAGRGRQGPGLRHTAGVLLSQLRTLRRPRYPRPAPGRQCLRRRTG